ncbi:hypothetical protein [Arenicella xantha]|uniref:aspartate kinase n=1 Tax=Arenicella xantha TaxID=644221 RepID=A0A395JNE7_9GAMM|nr:hypothetical protein [Arenicella xantha]RBP49604.1 aspartate kinase [Arenicella xantha]
MSTETTALSEQAALSETEALSGTTALSLPKGAANTETIVLKFGGSVLHSQADFERIHSEIHRYRSQNINVIAVVSAFFGMTEQLITQATAKQLSTDSVEFATLIASGEFQSAAALVNFLTQHDLKASCQTPADLEFVAHGERTKATPTSINAVKINSALAQTPVIVVPGFSAVDQHGECVLLGRGGSDISAVCIAHALGLESVRLLKDVNGLYDRDPNKFANANRLAYVDYATACRIGGELIQTEAIDFAATKSIAIDVAGIGSIKQSRIGPKRSEQTTKVVATTDNVSANKSLRSA